MNKKKVVKTENQLLMVKPILQRGILIVILTSVRHSLYSRMKSTVFTQVSLLRFGTFMHGSLQIYSSIIFMEQVCR